jgi:hypothetical protein
MFLSWLRWSWFASLLVASLLVPVVLANDGLGAPSVLLPIRRALFTSYTARFGELNEPVIGLQSVGFRKESAVAASSFRRSLSDTVLLRALDSISTITGTVARAQAIVRLFPGPKASASCGTVNDLAAKIRWVMSGDGCCSDHTEVFTALATMLGIETREIHSSTHTTAGFYAPELHQWVFVDPEYGLMAHDSSGRYLSTLQLRQEILSGRLPIFERLVQRASPLGYTPLEALYSDPSVFRRLWLTLGNNVIEADSQYRSLKWLPKPVNQLLGHVSGIRPGYRAYIPNATSSEVTVRNILHMLTLASSCALVLGLVAYPLLGALLWTRTRWGAVTAAVVVASLQTRDPFLRK